jgi:cytidylate kinase
MPSNLIATPIIATPIVDKNGRSTTVLKKLDTGASALQRVSNIKPVLPPASKPQKTSAKRLSPLGEITEEELRQLGQDHPKLSHSTRDVNSAIDILLAQTPPSTWALAKRVIDDGLDADVVVYLTSIHEDRVTRWWTKGKADADHAVDQLNNCMLVAERVERDYSDLKGWGGDFQGRLISSTMETYTQSQNLKRLCPQKLFRSEGNLDSAAAVTAFVMNCERNYEGVSGKFIRNMNVTVSGRSFMGTVITNSDVDAYIRECPQDMPRIMRYMEDYEYGNSEQDAETLISFLEETSESPLADGWL